jgi:2-polyprenyl-3-methyl-5-hydroxy-6-metoxy-1,4-benzoquinol methylase
VRFSRSGSGPSGLHPAGVDLSGEGGPSPSAQEVLGHRIAGPDRMDTQKMANIEKFLAASRSPVPAGSGQWDHATHPRFFDYYAKESQSDDARRRFARLRDMIIRMMSNNDTAERSRLEIVDIGCGAGTQSLVWAELGHSVHALDVNEPLVTLGRERAAKAGFEIDFQVGSATALPWGDGSVDVCLALELLEHVAEWERCLQEFMRILRPGGAVFLTTTNRLCPMQAEYNLPLYSWYPAAVKRRCERLAAKMPSLANYATYPAVNWFTYSGLRSYLQPHGFRCVDRFDMMDLDGKAAAERALVRAIRWSGPLRQLAHVCTRGTRLLAFKE